LFDLSQKDLSTLSISLNSILNITKTKDKILSLIKKTFNSLISIILENIKKLLLTDNKILNSEFINIYYIQKVFAFIYSNIKNILNYLIDKTENKFCLDDLNIVDKYIIIEMNKILQNQLYTIISDSINEMNINKFAKYHLNFNKIILGYSQITNTEPEKILSNFVNGKNFYINSVL
jgi:hypothetical protein